MKGSWKPEEFAEICGRYGFHGKGDLFRELTFDPFMQIPCEAYHLLFLGILKFFFRRLVEKLAPIQRDALNDFYKSYKFPGHLPQIHFGT